MTTPYLFASYKLDSQVTLSSYMSIKTGLFFFLTSCCIIILIFGIIDHYWIMEDLKKNWRKVEQIKNNKFERSWAFEEQQASGPILLVLIKNSLKYKSICLYTWRSFTKKKNESISKKCIFVSTSRPHKQNGFRVSGKPCLNFWSRKWLRPWNGLLRIWFLCSCGNYKHGLWMV